VLNNTQHRSIKQTPSKRLFGLEQKGKIVDESKEKLKELGNTKEDRDLEKIRSEAEKNQEKAQEYNKTQCDKTARKPTEYRKRRLCNGKQFRQHIRHL